MEIHDEAKKNKDKVDELALDKNGLRLENVVPFVAQSLTFRGSPTASCATYACIILCVFLFYKIIQMITKANILSNSQK